VPLLLLDNQMPFMSGFELANYLTTLKSHFLLSSENDMSRQIDYFISMITADEVAESEAVSINLVINKPLKNSDLDFAIDSWNSHINDIKNNPKNF